MPLTAQNIIASATSTLQDPGNTRWTAPELLNYLNEGIRTLVTKRPDVNPVKASMTPAPGVRQEIPPQGIVFIDVIGNTSGNQRAVTRVESDLMTAINRDWKSSRASAVARHFMFDMREPRYFDLFPPSNGLGSIDILYSAFPDPLTAAIDVLPVSDQWSNPLLNFVLSRAYAKDAEYGGNATAVAGYMAAFNAEIGDQLQSSTTVSPKS